MKSPTRTSQESSTNKGQEETHPEMRAGSGRRRAGGSTCGKAREIKLFLRLSLLTKQSS